MRLSIEQPLEETLGRIVAVVPADRPVKPIKHSAAEASFPSISRMHNIMEGLQRIGSFELDPIELADSPDIPPHFCQTVAVPQGRSTHVVFEDEPVLLPAVEPQLAWRAPAPEVLHFDGVNDGITRMLNGRAGVVDPINCIDFVPELD